MQRKDRGINDGVRFLGKIVQAARGERQAATAPGGRIRAAPAAGRNDGNIAAGADGKIMQSMSQGRQQQMPTEQGRSNDGMSERLHGPYYS